MLRLRVRRDSSLDLSDGSPHADAMSSLQGHRAGVGVPVPAQEQEGRLKLLTSYWSNPALRRTDAVKVSISRGQPRWPLPFRYRRATLLAPSRETFALEDDADFEREYLRELEEAGVEKIRDLLRRLSDEGDGGPLVLLCWEKPGTGPCHRWQFARFWYDKTGEVIEELPGAESGKVRDNERGQLRLWKERSND